jgi:hypothetical protein
MVQWILLLIAIIIPCNACIIPRIDMAGLYLLQDKAIYMPRSYVSADRQDNMQRLTFKTSQGPQTVHYIAPP